MKLLLFTIRQQAELMKNLSRTRLFGARGPDVYASPIPM